MLQGTRQLWIERCMWSSPSTFQQRWFSKEEYDESACSTLTIAKDLSFKVVFAGGTAMIQGICERVANELILFSPRTEHFETKLLHYAKQFLTITDTAPLLRRSWTICLSRSIMERIGSHKPRRRFLRGLRGPSSRAVQCERLCIPIRV